jgi:hypothetical protein
MLMRQAWGGARLYMGNRDQIYEALHDFIGNNYKDPKAAVIFTGELKHLPTLVPEN